MVSLNLQAGCKFLHLSHWSWEPGPSPHFQAHVHGPFHPIFLPCGIWLPTKHSSVWCLEGTSDKMLHLASPSSEELTTPFIQLLRPKSYNHAHLPFSQVSPSNPSVSPSRYIKNLISLLPPHTALHLLPGLQDGLQTVAFHLFPETTRIVLLTAVKSSHSFVQTVFHLTL